MPVILEHSSVMDISSRLVVNRAAMKMKSAQVKGLIQRLEQAVASRGKV